MDTVSHQKKPKRRPVSPAQWMTDEGVAQTERHNRLAKQAVRSKIPDRSAASETMVAYLARVMRAVRRWCDDHADRVSSCHLTPVDDTLELRVVARSPEYDRQLTASARVLDLLLLDMGCRADVSVLPNASDDELSAFVSPEAETVYAAAE